MTRAESVAAYARALAIPQPCGCALYGANRPGVVPVLEACTRDCPSVERWRRASHVQGKVLIVLHKRADVSRDMPVKPAVLTPDDAARLARLLVKSREQP